jgi:hypothetical protein
MGATPYGPMQFGQIVDRIYRLMRARFKLFMGIAVVPSAVMLVAVVGLEAAFFIPAFRNFPKPPDPADLAQIFKPAIMIPSFVLIIVISLAITSIWFAASSYAATRADAGAAIGFGDAYRMAWARAGRHLWLLVQLYLWAALPLILVELGFLLGSSLMVRGNANGNPGILFVLFPLGILLYLAALIYALLAGLRLSLAFPACVEEGLPAGRAIKRSLDLTKGAMGRIFLVLLLVYAILYAGILAFEIVAMLVGVIIALAGTAMNVHWAAPWSYVGLGTLGICVLAIVVFWTALSWASMTAALAVLYHDQRLRKDTLIPVIANPGDPA